MILAFQCTVVALVNAEQLHYELITGCLIFGTMCYRLVIVFL